MAKIDYKKVEERLAQALHTLFIKNLLKGHSTVSIQAVNYYRLDDGPRPKQEDSVIQGLKELAEEAKIEELLEKAKAEEASQIQPIKIPDSLPEAVKPRVPVAPIFLLHNHLLWFKKKKVKDVYAILQTSEEEITCLQKAVSLNEADQKRVAKLLQKAESLKTTIMQKLGIEDDTAVIEKERKKHLTKRFNIKESWLPLDTH